ncbi:MAG: VPDSG-CTERM sorting domain-containing protein [Haloferula sp.]
MTVAGFGIAKAAGMKDTLAAFTMKGNEGKFSYRVEMAQTTIQSRSQNAAKHVPDGGSTVALLGVSLLGLQGGRRLLKSIRA